MNNPTSPPQPPRNTPAPPETPSSWQSPRTVSKTPLQAPGHRDLYLLIAGIVAGILLGPAVLGQALPGVHDRLWVGSGPARSELAAFDKQQAQALARLEQSGATPEAAAEKRAWIKEQRWPLEAAILLSQKQHRDWLQGRAAALVLALVVIMVIEAMLGAMPGRFWETLRWRLTTIRYAFMAIWIALLLAEPSAIAQASTVSFVALLVLLSLLAVCVPLRWLNPRRPDPGTDPEAPTSR